MSTSCELAAEAGRFPVWDARCPFPSFDTMPDLDVVTHVSIEKAQPDGYHYLHESGIAAHRGVLHIVWANHREAECNVTGELIRGATSNDGGLTWSPARTIAEAPMWGSRSFNHPAIATHADQLWGFFTRWDDQKDTAKNQYKSCCNAEGVGPQPSVEIVRYDDAKACWTTTGARIPGFLPFRPPLKMRDGNWIMGGECYWYEAAVATSHGDDWTAWDLVLVPKPEGMTLLFPETALIDQGDRIVAVCRPDPREPMKMTTAPASTSTDCGRTWTPLALSNFPLAASQPYAGTLSTGQHYLITDNLEEQRGLLTIAVTRPGERLFSRIWKVRHQHFPRRRLFPGYLIDGEIKGNQRGGKTEWSYPAAVEHDGKLFISYTQGKEDCVLSIVPVSALAVV